MFHGSKRLSQDEFFPHEKNLKKAGIKKLQGVKCLVFSTFNDILPVAFTMAET